MSDSGTIVLGWLTRLVVGFALLGVVAYDGISVVVANVQAADNASVAASAAAEAYQVKRDEQAAYQAAVDAVPTTDGIEPREFSVARNGVVTLTVERLPTTLWMHRIGPLRSWTVVHQTATGTPPA